ncbi:MAG TPA: Rossmann-like and DUF2520 domain-containing protein [Pyrinomonadaceae bacterium]|nr:Rossmann-like and DUF2520 domain-containing protein [Pyrinomonadaceae bacterium]
MPIKAKPSVVVIGPGRLGQALAIALNRASYPILAFAGRDLKHAKQAALRLNQGAKKSPRVEAFGIADLAKLPAFKLAIISTPDDAIAETALRLRSIGRTRNATVLHTSGALSSEVLAPLAELGFHTGSMHPLVSVSEPDAGAKTLRGAFFCVEGDASAVRIARKVVGDLDSTAFSIKTEHKALYHAAAVVASPHLVALFDIAVEMLSASGLSRSRAIEVLLPLAESTVRNLRVSNPENALTGTFARGDVATVRKHLAALSKKELADALAAYKLLGLRSIEIAQKNKLDPELLKRIRKLLK